MKKLTADQATEVMAELEAELRRGIACVDGDHDLHHSRKCGICFKEQLAHKERVIDKACNWLVSWRGAFSLSHTTEKILCDLEESVRADAQKEKAHV